MFESDTLPREELEQRYEQAGVLIHLIKQAMPDAVFDAFVRAAGNLWEGLKRQEVNNTTPTTNLPPGWVVYDRRKQ